jgi:hypothetical protein
MRAAFSPPDSASALWTGLCELEPERYYAVRVILGAGGCSAGGLDEILRAFSCELAELGEGVWSSRSLAEVAAALWRSPALRHVEIAEMVDLSDRADRCEWHPYGTGVS